jgi:dimethylamine/trimethylamine dehydrogenase
MTPARDPRFDTLFDEVKIGPVRAPNRFYQVPHCTGMGFRSPNTLAVMREMKAEGGWGVVCTEYCSIHPSSDDSPLAYASLWDEDDVRAHASMVDRVHRHGALAGVQLWHGGSTSSNLYSRAGAMGPASRPVWRDDPVQCRAMDKRDIKSLLQWQVDAAKRAARAGFDIVYVYATHGYLLSQFLAPSNTRTDEYGGSLGNRVRLVREMLEETRRAVGDRCAVAIRLAADAGTTDGVPETDEQREIVGLLGDLPDLWDINIHDYSYEMGTSRFVKEAALDDYVSYVKTLTGKPVVGVGRFTSPETMLRQVNEGRLDLIGCARPSIADPFLPAKIEQGRMEDIRECIGCNICYASNSRTVPLQCTQNPTIGEEWRRGWHPENIPDRGSDKSVLVVGGGPAGLEAARALGQRGYDVTLAERGRSLGGRVSKECTLPGLAEWSRVVDWRISQIEKLDNVQVYYESEVDEAQIDAFGADEIVLATGSHWRSDGVGRSHDSAIDAHSGMQILTPDDVMGGRVAQGNVVIFDDDHYYMGGALAEALARSGCSVKIVTPASLVSSWSQFTDDQPRIQARLLNLGVGIESNSVVSAILGDAVELRCRFTGTRRQIECSSVVMVTAREPNDVLYRSLMDRMEVAAIGDCLAPGTIAKCVHDGHTYAREMDDSDRGNGAFRRERVFVDPVG